MEATLRCLAASTASVMFGFLWWHAQRAQLQLPVSAGRAGPFSCCWWQDRMALQQPVEATAAEGQLSGWHFPGLSARAVAVLICPFPRRAEAVARGGALFLVCWEPRPKFLPLLGPH